MSQQVIVELLDNNDQPQGTWEELKEREERIERAQRNAYYEIGLDLGYIRDKRLYKIERPETISGRYSFMTFEEYVGEKWEMSYRRTVELIESANAAEKLRNSASFPTRESHVRPLLKLASDEERAAVWQTVIDRGETVTAKLVEAEVDMYLARKIKDWFTLDEWNAMSGEDRDKLFAWKSEKTFNKQKDDSRTVEEGGSIEWAQWSWNPVTGCLHGCEYCYAADIANRFYPQKFVPTFHPGRLMCPENTRLPNGDGPGARNVFVCSMADLFGEWVPKEWIMSVLSRVERAPDWNFLFLTKNPAKLSSFTFPINAWVGTTVDTQARVKAAEKAFAKLEATVKFVSVEPMLEDLKFTKLDLFDWIIIGGGSRSSNTDAYRPPREWVNSLYAQSRKAGCMVYEKPNLLQRITEYPKEND